MNFNKTIKRLIRRPIIKLGVLLAEFEPSIAKATLPQFSNKPNNLVIDKPRRIINSEHVRVGDDVYIGPSSMIIAITSYPDRGLHPPENVEVNCYDPTIIIGNRVNSTGNLIIAALNKIEIGDDVIFASNVFISDGFHGYQNIDLPYKYQPMERILPVVIGQGCWVGQNVVILPGITIGEMVIIAANSVVTKNLPPRCIAMGAPARVIKLWDEENSCWSEA